MSETEILRYQNISKRFGGVNALVDVSFAINRGEIHGLVGENGAGKSTLIKITGGIYRKDTGQVYWNGSSIDVASPIDAQNLGISIVHQEIPLCSNLTIAQNVFMGNLITKGVTPDWPAMEKRTVELFHQIGQEVNPRQKVGELSVAMRQLTAIVQALRSNSQFIIMDEPTAALTPSEVETLFEVLRRLKAEGTTIMLVSHILSEIMTITDRVTVLRNGRHVATVNTEDTSIPEIISMMVGDIPLPTHKESLAKKDDVVLEVKNLNKASLGLRDINFRLHRQEILGVAGIQGAGRTELATCLFGLYPPDSGTIEMEGKAVNITSPRAAIEAGMGYLTEDRRNLGIFSDMNIWQNSTAVIIDELTKPGAVLDQKEIDEVASRSVKDLRIRTPGLEQKIRYLSGGNQQKVMLARWLNAKPKVLILDEPTRGVDVGAKAEIRRVIQDLVSQGISVIVISSDLEELLNISDRVLVMANGTIRGEYLAHEASTDKVMALATLK
ncbi:MAG: sugar ABC transporter ATP-binding protein [Firmicutes bacterium]|jgi:ribose transport system ATP-binding protein|nr:sugar ABC transporter ATP-binding protein [Bacillota bacterium]